MPVGNPTGGWALSDADKSRTFANPLRNVFQANLPTSAFTLPTLPYEHQHGIIEKVNRITSEIRNRFEKREYCTAIFFDVSQAFD